MLKFTINGKSIGSGDIAKEMKRVVFDSVAKQFRERLGSIRHPETGEFAMVIISGDSVEDMAIRVEGSAALLDIVKSRMSSRELESMTFVATDPVGNPRVFLSYGFEDRELAKRIAEGLQCNGIATWWAEWEICAGDSLRRKIDAGLGQCTHFIVLLTPTSVLRTWVNEEIDAGYMRKINAGSRFIPLRHRLEAAALPPLMSGMFSPAIDDGDLDLQQLINDIYGISRRPPLGPAPQAVAGPNTGYSLGATAVARMFVNSSLNGQFNDPQLTLGSIGETTGLSDDDVTDAIHELSSFFKVIHDHVIPKPTLFAEFDSHWQGWTPADDALKLASDLVNDNAFPSDPSAIAVKYGWAPRRLNPAIAYLDARGAVVLLSALASGPYIGVSIRKNDSTRRFVKSRSI